VNLQGDWTEALHEHYDSKQIVDGKPVFSLSSHTLQVDGPHGAPAQVLMSFSRIISGREIQAYIFRVR